MVSLIVVTTGDREAELNRLLVSLKAQQFCDFETIVVDHRNHPEFLMNASRARNFGVLRAKGDIVAFPDDDCWYQPDTLQEVKTFFAEHLDLAGVVGLWKRCRREPITKYNVFHQAGTCFYFVRKEAILAVGGFDEELGPGADTSIKGAEDTDLLLRIMANGGKVNREPDIRIFHPDMPLNVAALTKVRDYGTARIFLLKRHGYPLWFIIANVIFPLVRLLMRPRQYRYWLSMFCGRIQGIVQA